MNYSPFRELEWPPSGDLIEKREWSDVESASQFDNVDQADVAFATLDSANVVSMKIG